VTLLAISDMEVIQGDPRMGCSARRPFFRIAILSQEIFLLDDVDADLGARIAGDLDCGRAAERTLPSDHRDNRQHGRPEARHMQRDAKPAASRAWRCVNDGQQSQSAECPLPTHPAFSGERA
jgi:hypothetical protein